MKLIPLISFFLKGKLIEGTNNVADAFDLDEDIANDLIANGRVRAATKEDLAESKKK